MSEAAGGAKLCLRHSSGKSVKKGEDAFAVNEDGVWRHEDWEVPYSYFAVFDGHGGKQAAQMCRTTLERQMVEALSSLADEEREQGGTGDGGEEATPACDSASLVRRLLPRALARAFEAVDDAYCAAHGHAGTTATACVLTRGGDDDGGVLLTTANVGDSHAYVDTNSQVVLVSVDHRLDSSREERERVKLAGGAVAQSAVGDSGRGVGPLRAWPGGLAMGRTIGDPEARPCVVALPDVTQCWLPQAGARLVVGSDGLWDALSPKAVSKAIHGRNGGGAAIAQHLAKAALRARGPRDDITCLVVDVLHFPEQGSPWDSLSPAPPLRIYRPLRGDHLPPSFPEELRARPNFGHASSATTVTTAPTSTTPTTASSASAADGPQSTGSFQGVDTAAEEDDEGWSEVPIRKGARNAEVPQPTVHQEESMEGAFEQPKNHRKKQKRDAKHHANKKHGDSRKPAVASSKPGKGYDGTANSTRSLDDSGSKRACTNGVHNDQAEYLKRLADEVSASASETEAVLARAREASGKATATGRKSRLQSVRSRQKSKPNQEQQAQSQQGQSLEQDGNDEYLTGTNPNHTQHGNAPRKQTGAKPRLHRSRVRDNRPIIDTRKLAKSQSSKENHQVAAPPHASTIESKQHAHCLDHASTTEFSRVPMLPPARDMPLPAKNGTSSVRQLAPQANNGGKGLRSNSKHTRPNQHQEQRSHPGHGSASRKATARNSLQTTRSSEQPHDRSKSGLRGNGSRKPVAPRDPAPRQPAQHVLGKDAVHHGQGYPHVQTLAEVEQRILAASLNR